MKKIILITGASSGMGKETALQLIQDGHIVYGAARRVELMQELVENGGYALPVDMTNEQSMETLVEQIIQEQGKIDVLINNAGYAVYGAIEDITIDEARRQFEVNIFGLGRLTQLVLPHMREKKSGRIINISSMGGKMYTPLGAWYHATKHALEGWSDCLRLEVKQFGIDVVIIEPGAIKTEFDQVMLQPLLDRSKGGAYENLAGKVAQGTRKFYEKKNSSPSSVIADVISKAVRVKRPKTRYAKGKMAKLMIFLRVYLGDRFFDWMVMSQVK